MATETIEATDHKLILAGERVETGEWKEVKSPYDGTPIGRVPEAGADEVNRAIAAAREAFEEGGFPQHERAAVLDRAAHIVRDREDELAATIAAEAGKPIKTARVEAQRTRRHPDLLLGRGAQAHGRDGPDGGRRGRRGQARLRAPGPVRSGRRHQPLQLPAQPGRPQARTRDRRRQRRRAEARGPDAHLGHQARRDPARGRAAGALAQRDHRPGLRGGQRARRERADARAHLHRLGAGRLGHPRQGRPQEGQPRAGVDRSSRGERRRRLGAGGRQGPGPRLFPRRPELHLGPADPAARVDRG